MQGFVIRAVNSFYYVFCEDSKTYECKKKGIFHSNFSDNEIICGDFVTIEQENSQSIWVIQKVLPRTNYMRRPKIANIDLIVLVVSFYNPKVSTFTLDKYLAYFEARNYPRIIIVVSKLSITPESEKIVINPLIEDYKRCGYEVYDAELEYKLIQDIMASKKTILVGQSGVGKSTLLNRINPGFNRKIQDVNISVNRGKHTTTATELLKLNDSWIADSPGFSQLDIRLTKQELGKAFHDFETLSQKCKYNDCIHISENGCNIIKNVYDGIISKERYNNYLKMQRELENE
jgi:ribosome biogenesis GTPase